MKTKLLIVALCAALLVTGGCAAMNVLKNILGTAQTIICSPTVDQVADAVAALDFFEKFPTLKGKYVVAVSVFQNIRDKVCVSIPQIEIALNAIDEIGAIMKGQATARGVSVRSASQVQVPKLAALRALVAK